MKITLNSKDIEELIKQVYPNAGTILFNTETELEASFEMPNSILTKQTIKPIPFKQSTPIEEPIKKISDEELTMLEAKKGVMGSKERLMMRF